MFSKGLNGSWLVLVMACFLLVTIASTVQASCSIEKVCELVAEQRESQNELDGKNEDNKSEADSNNEAEGKLELSKTAIGAIKSSCKNKMHNSDCPVDQVITFCMQEESTEVVIERCEEIE